MAKSKLTLKCLKCMVEITPSAKNNKKLEDHINSKHPNCSMGECFPTRTKEALAAAAAKAAKAAKKGGGRRAGRGESKSQSLDDKLAAGLAGGKKKKKGKKGGRRG